MMGLRYLAQTISTHSVMTLPAQRHVYHVNLGMHAVRGSGMNVSQAHTLMAPLVSM